MSATPPRVVFDAMVFVQALIGGRGAAAACVDRALDGKAILLLSDATLAEVQDVPLRPELTRRYAHLTQERVHGFIQSVRALAIHLPSPAKAMTLPRDPKDEPYLDLAVEGGASFLVTWNERHLTYLMRGDTPEGVEFRQRFPSIEIVPPPEFLRRIERAPESGA